MRAEGFSCSFGQVNSNFWSKYNFYFGCIFFFLFLVIKTLDPELDPDPQLEKNPRDPDPH
jgi:hypothetical protein